MAHSKLSEAEKQDLGEIWDYIAEDNIEIADQFTDEFFGIFRLLANNKEMGKTRHELLPNLRSFPHKRYTIFYLPNVYGVEIYRVLHSSRDVNEEISSE